MMKYILLVLSILSVPLGAQESRESTLRRRPVKTEAPKPITGAGAETAWRRALIPNVYTIGGAGRTIRSGYGAKWTLRGPMWCGRTGRSRFRWWAKCRRRG